MEQDACARLCGFYTDALKNNILRYWLPRCRDPEGGFVNCFSNDGTQLLSWDKYAWSQGRFVWVFARLAVTPAPVFSREERAAFLELAGHGADFLMRRCLVAPDDWRVVFLMDRSGAPKRVAPGAPLDMSIYADCFVIAGLAMYAYASGRRDVYDFAKTLYDSAENRLLRHTYRMLPYPLSDRFRCHGIPMIFSNVSRELYRAALALKKEDAPALLQKLWGFASDILEHFVDGDGVLHEVITADNAFFPQILGQYMNPGHTIEDAWFLLDAAGLCGRPDCEERIFLAAKRALENGWDAEYGGLLHFCGVRGGQPSGDDAGVADETMTRQLSGWADKLWWVHSEALYTTLLCWKRSGQTAFLDWYRRVSRYTFDTFPNPDASVGEWIQIRTRGGSPQEKTVALPVKDPFHISRDMILILELLCRSPEAEPGGSF